MVGGLTGQSFRARFANLRIPSQYPLDDVRSGKPVRFPVPRLPESSKDPLDANNNVL